MSGHPGESRAHPESALLTEMGDVCAIGNYDDGTLRVCCSTHAKVLCAHHYARTHFVMTMPEYATEHACWHEWDCGIAGGLPHARTAHSGSNQPGGES